MNDTLTIRLGAELASALEQEARQTGLSRGELARRALSARLQPQRRLAVLRRHFGRMSGPSDLSTNRAYRATWGAKRT